jgi:c-di-GMP-binding flagellar brake protein YcgR
VEDGPTDAGITVAWPTDAARDLLRLEPGQAVQVQLIAPEDAAYTAGAVVQELMPGHVPLVRLSLAGSWQRQQRRSAVRTRVAIKPRRAEVVYSRDVRRTLRLGLTSLSASGVQVRSLDELRAGDLLELSFELDDDVKVRARVRRVGRLERGWEAGCAFEDITDSVSDRIVRFIFAHQRAALRARSGSGPSGSPGGFAPSPPWGSMGPTPR